MWCVCFFFNQKTAYEMRISDWSSDVCSSDLIDHRDLLLREVHHRVKNNLQMVDAMLAMQCRQVEDARTLGSIEQLRARVHALAVVHAQLMTSQIGRASGRGRECQDG